MTIDVATLPDQFCLHIDHKVLFTPDWKHPFRPFDAPLHMKRDDYVSECAKLGIKCEHLSSKWADIYRFTLDSPEKKTAFQEHFLG